MIPYAIIVDDFFPQKTFELLRQYVVSTEEWKTITNPKDGIAYPEVIYFDSSPDTQYIAEMISRIMGSKVVLKMVVLRRSMAGVECPEQAHTDISIADSTFSAIIYLNDGKSCKGGTELLEHIETGAQNGHQKGWQDDKNRPDAWIVRLSAQMVPNRIFISPSELIHRSMPIGGFGKTPEDARVVMVVLFDLEQ